MLRQPSRGAALALALVALLLLSACGSSPSKPKTTSTPTPSASQTATTEAAVTASWEKFFSGATPGSEKIPLLVNGSQFATTIDALAGSSLAKSVSATVSKVVLVNANNADVTYTILLAGAPALSDQSGGAVLQGGTWKVSTASFCKLLALENGGNTSSLPPACATASPPASSSS